MNIYFYNYVFQLTAVRLYDFPRLTSFIKKTNIGFIIFYGNAKYRVSIRRVNSNGNWIKFLIENHFQIKKLYSGSFEFTSSGP